MDDETLDTNISEFFPEEIYDRMYTRASTGEVTEEVTITAVADGETTTVTVNVTGILPPLTASVSYNTTDPTNDPVTATLLASDAINTPDGWTQVDDMTYTKIYTQNTTEDVAIAASTGVRTASAAVAVANIAVLSGETALTPTSTGSVLVTLTTNKAINTPDTWTKVDDKTFTKDYTSDTTEDVSITATVDDETVSVSVTVTGTLPALTGTVSYSTTELTDDPVTATLTTSAIINTPDGWTQVDDTTFTKLYAQNTEEEVTIAATTGVRTATVTISIANINTLSATVDYAPTYTGSVIATLTANKAILTPDGWTKVSDTVYTKEYIWTE